MKYKVAMENKVERGTIVGQAIDKERLREVIAETIEVEVEELTDDKDFMADLGVDSLVALEVLVVLEKEFGVKLEESQLSEVTSLGNVYALLTNTVES